MRIVFWTMTNIKFPYQDYRGGFRNPSVRPWTEFGKKVRPRTEHESGQKSESVRPPWNSVRGRNPSVRGRGKSVRTESVPSADGRNASADGSGPSAFRFGRTPSVHGRTELFGGRTELRRVPSADGGRNSDGRNSATDGRRRISKYPPV